MNKWDIYKILIQSTVGLKRTEVTLATLYRFSQRKEMLRAFRYLCPSQCFSCPHLRPQ